MSKIFSEEICSVIAEGKGSLTSKILYEMCDERVHPWGGERQLAEKLRIVCGVYGLTLRENYLCYGRTERGAYHRNIDVYEAIAAQLAEHAAYGAFVEKIAVCDRGLAFDGSVADLGLLKEGVSLVLELNGLFSEAVTAYDKKYRQPARDRGNYYALSARLLHLHRPETVFPYGRAIREGMMHFRNAVGCRLGEAVLQGADKDEIRAAFYEAFQGLGALAEGKSELSPEWMYLSAAALSYALCRYFEAHGISPEGLFPTALAASIVEKLQRVLTKEEIEKIAGQIKYDTPIEEARLYCRDAVEFEQVFMARCAHKQK